MFTFGGHNKIGIFAAKAAEPNSDYTIWRVEFADYEFVFVNVDFVVVQRHDHTLNGFRF